MSPPILLLTGSTGFTGLHLSRLAQQLGYRVIGLKANLNDVPALEKEVLEIKPRYVVHLAGISFVASKDHEAFYRVHALGTGNLLQALTQLPSSPEKILLASSATVYGNSSNPLSIESHTTEPLDHYAMSKVAMEEIAKTFFLKLPLIIARPFNYTGPGQKGNFLIPKLVAHFAEKKSHIELGNLDIEREFNDVRMICDAYLQLLKVSPTNEIFNVCSGNARSLQFVIDSLVRLTGHNIDIQINPNFVRAKEVHRMCGDPSKLQTLFQNNQINIDAPPFTETLDAMLKAYKPILNN